MQKKTQCIFSGYDWVTFLLMKKKKTEEFSIFHSQIP